MKADNTATANQILKGEPRPLEIMQRFGAGVEMEKARNKKLPTVQHRTMQGQEQETYNGSKSLDAGPGTPDILLRETSVYQPTTPHQRLHIDVYLGLRRIKYWD
ncbi:hypothetical protein RRG08_004784 [Elysia crispata]|uniref:Uncharacterized protein n=1 Tax=Elysia crispata TaxID=231223 RepID=A0AAE1DZA3_9GAST|nr:hypothetical protein RRG08_004784 [Elysia crispata]